VDIVFTADDITAADQAISTTGDIYDDLDLKSSSLGTAGVFNTPGWASGTRLDYVVDSGATGVTVCVINRSTGNGTTAKTSGKFLVWLKILCAGDITVDSTI
jgi:hypothetical protein